jgi:hypothetical protein
MVATMTLLHPERALRALLELLPLNVFQEFLIALLFLLRALVLLTSLILMILHSAIETITLRTLDAVKNRNTFTKSECKFAIRSRTPR